MKKTVANRRMFRQGGAVNSGPTGILASSPSLIDAVAQDAMNVQGGPTVRMADGGIVRMANGGPVFPLVPTRTPQIASDAFGVRFDPTTARRARNETGLMPADKLVFEELGDTGRRIFPLELEPGQADIEKVRRGQPVSNLERAAFSALGGLRSIGQNAAEYLQATGGKLMEKEIAGQPGALPDVSITQREAIKDMTKMYPEIKGFIENEAFLAIKANPELSPEELKGTVARALEAPERRGAEDAFLQGISRFGPQEDEVMTDMTDADPEYVGDVPLDPGQDDTLDEEDERTDPTGEVRGAEAQGQDDDASFLAGITPPRKPDTGVPKDPGQDDTLDEKDEGGSAAKQFAEVFKKPNVSQEEASKTLADYKKDFIDAMPEYEGASQQEKGVALMEAGLRVAAGESPDAITNVAKGLKGLASEFFADAKERRKYNRQVELSAAKYGLEQMAKDEARDRSDRRNRITMYDMSDPKKPKAVSIGMDQILANNGELPSDLVGANIMAAQIKSANDTAARLRKSITDIAKDAKITVTEEKDLRKRLSGAREKFVSGHNAVQLLGQTKAKVAAGDITGFGAGFKELVRRGYTLAGLDIGREYKNISSARADVKRAFQSLIPVSLGSTQTANSISNRDVEFLANAYVNQAFLQDGIFSLATIDDAALGKQLDGAIKLFRDKEREGLADYDSVLKRIRAAEQGVRGAQAAGAVVSVGPFGADYFSTQVGEISPFAERTRARLAGKASKPTFKLELQNGVYRRVPVG